MSLWKKAESEARDILKRHGIYPVKIPTSGHLESADIIAFDPVFVWSVEVKTTRKKRKYFTPGNFDSHFTFLEGVRKQGYTVMGTLFLYLSRGKGKRPFKLFLPLLEKEDGDLKIVRKKDTVVITHDKK